MPTTIHKIHEVGQSIWCDNISRGMIDSGELQRLIDLGIVGVTSNPTIFMKAITGGSDYDQRIEALQAGGCDLMGLYEGLVLPDIVDAADILRPVHDRTDGVDGFVSFEVSPKLAYDTAGTVEEARRLHAEIDRPNVFIKVPATEQGIPAIETLIGEGISVNVTLIFGIDMYEKVMRAYIDGVHRLASGGGDVTRIASVASFFVSRVDTLVDGLLQEKRAAGEKVDHLLGKAANANAKVAYARFGEVFGKGGAFDELAASGARVQRPLWASTSAKNPAYPDTIYVDPLIGPDTVNTLPPKTIEAVLDHGATKSAIADHLSEARQALSEIAALGIDMKEVTKKLESDGVASFAKSFDELLENLAAKQQRLTAAG